MRLTDVQLVNRIRSPRLDIAFAVVELPYCPHCMLNKTIFAWIHLCLDIRDGVCPSAVTLRGSHFRALRREQPSVWLEDALFAVTHGHQFLCLLALDLRKGSSRRAGSSSRTAAESGYVRLWRCIAFYSQCDLLWCSSMFKWPSVFNGSGGGGAMRRFGWRGTTLRSDCTELHWGTTQEEKRN